MEKLDDRKKYYKKIIVFIFIIAMFFTILSFAASDVKVDYMKENGVQYITFKLEHNITTTAYKYFGYGYHVTVYDNDDNEIGYKFLTNAEFKPEMMGGIETVKIKIEDLYNKTDVETKYYYRQDCTIRLNGRLGILVNGTTKYMYDSLGGNIENNVDKGIGTLETGYVAGDGVHYKSGNTIPLNKDGYGIRNGLEHEYGISWSQVTQDNLEQHFGINFTLDPIYRYDGFEVLYKEVATGKTISSQKPIQNFNKEKTITEYPQSVNGYEYSGNFKIEKTDTKGDKTIFKDITQSDSATVNLQQTASIYTIIFYYNKIDLSTIGNPVTIDVEYRENTSDGKELIKNESFIGGELSPFNLNSKKIDGYTCIGHFIIGQATEYFYSTNASFTIKKERYSIPVNSRLKIIFIYTKDPIIEIPKCSPSVNGTANSITITMKEQDFKNATEISINNAIFKISDFTYGKDINGNSVDGIHKFKYFDLYVDKYISSFDNTSTEVTQSFIVPKSIFTQSADDTSKYTASIKTTFAAFCTCYDGGSDGDGDSGWTMDNANLNVTINIIENKPPIADFNYYSAKLVGDEDAGKIYDKAFIGLETVINNKALDPNGLTDIKKMKYTLTDSNNNQYNVNLLMMQDETYILDTSNIDADNIQFNGTNDNGNLLLEFLTIETWTVSQYVEDYNGLNDTYTTTITTEELNLKPIAIIADNINYRYPVVNQFNGKENRVVMFNSLNSQVAEYYFNTGIVINHNRDVWEIIPLNGQDLSNIKFNTDLNTFIVNNVLNIKYQSINTTKMMFKEAGQYKLRLQVTDILGNISDWTEQIITINEDKLPTVTANISSKYYRDSTGYAKINITSIILNSIDEDITTLENIRYRYDTNNNNNFNDENWTSLGNITYLNTMNLGNYQFEITAKENFGQETLESYITDLDYKRNQIFLYTEIDNIAPNVTKFKIMTTEN